MLERHTRSWLEAHAAGKPLARASIEAAMLSHELRKAHRLDLGALLALHLYRAAWDHRSPRPMPFAPQRLTLPCASLSRRQPNFWTKSSRSSRTRRRSRTPSWTSGTCSPTRPCVADWSRPSACLLSPSHRLRLADARPSQWRLWPRTTPELHVRLPINSPPPSFQPLQCSPERTSKRPARSSARFRSGS